MEEKENPGDDSLYYANDWDGNQQSEITSIRKESLPLCVRQAGLFCIQGETKKLRSKYDTLKWAATASYCGVTKTKCVNPSCNVERFIWLCSRKCKGAETKDSRCCKFTTPSSALFIKYVGDHHPECEALNLQQKPQMSIKGMTSEERVSKK